MMNDCRRFAVALCLGVCAATTAFGAEPESAVPTARMELRAHYGESHPERLLIRFKGGVGAAKRQAVHHAAGATTVSEIRAVPGLALVHVPAGTKESALATYSGDPSVRYCEPDYTVFFSTTPDDPEFPELWGLHNVGQAIDGYPGQDDADIDAPEAWDTWTGDQAFRIAVIDTGVDYSHDDLADNIWTNPGEIPDNGLDDDGNGYIDDVHGYDFGDQDPDPMDEDGHGTHIAGTIGAIGDNGTGVTGVNWHCSIVPLKIDGGSAAFMSAAVAAVQYCIDNHIPVSSNSWSGPYSQALYDVIEAARSAGHLFVASTGNFALNEDVTDTPSYPSGFDLENVISVAAADNAGIPAAYTNWGAERVDLGAPGDGVWSTAPDNAYAYRSGTSMAVPHVAGVAALVWSQFPGLPWKTVRGAILDTVARDGSFSGITTTGGMLNAFNAVARLNDDCNSNSVADGSEIASGTAADCDGNAIPDSCEWLDCNSNGILDACDVLSGLAQDCNDNAVPDQCEASDCNANGTFDGCDIRDSTSSDCNSNWLPDECDIAGGGSSDVDGDGIPDECAARSVFVDGGCGDDSSSGEESDCAAGDTGPMATMAAALRRARAGDTVVVADGNYGGHGNINLEINEKPLHLACPSASCVVDVGERGRFAAIRAPGEVELSGFSVLNGKRSVGGAIVVSGQGDYSLTGCRFSGNSAGLGGVVYQGTSVLSISASRFEGNTATIGAVAEVELGDLELTDCELVDNAADWGGGIWNIFGRTGFQGCSLIGNTAANSGGLVGSNGGDAGFETAVTMSRSVVRDNSALRGGAIYNPYGELELTNCEFSGNSADEGGAVYNTGSRSKRVSNSTFVANSADLGGAIFTRGARFEVTNTIAWANTHDQIHEDPFTIQPAMYSCIQGGYPGEGNVDADPRFVDQAGGDFRLAAGSPLINAGTNDAEGVSELDLAGDPRVQHCRVDIGAYESAAGPAHQVDCNGNGIEDDCDLYDGGSQDFDSDWIPDECQDCNTNGIPDACDVDCSVGICSENPSGCGGSDDLDGDGIPDECAQVLNHLSWVEIVAGLDGAEGSRWKTDVACFNVSPEPAQVELVLHAEAQDHVLSWSIDAASQAVFEDLVGLMGVSGKGALELRSDHELRVVGRIYNQEESGSFGQFLKGHSPGDGLDTGESVWLLGLRQQDGLFRTNISVTNTGGSLARVVVNLYRTNGDALTEYSLDIPPHRVIQDLAPFAARAHVGDLGWGFASVAVESGSGIIASASVIDSITNDATTVSMSR